MSDAGSCDQNGDLADQDNICRDFLRNVCHRGNWCKYRHPDPNEAKEMGRKINYIFCHDFQNTECHRPNCKFIHCSKPEEMYYYTTGELPSCVAEAMGQGGGGDVGVGSAVATTTATNADADSDIPVCLDYLKGVCRRRGRCKYRHVSPSDYDMEMRMGMRQDTYGMYNEAAPYDNYEYYEPERKRRMFDDFGNNSAAPVYQTMQTAAPLPTDYYMLEEENVFLRRKLEELKKQVAELSAANEFLLDQNAQLRLGKQNANPMAGASTPVPPSIAQMSQQSPYASDAQLPQELAAVANPIVPVSLSASALAPVTISSVALTPGIPTASLAQSLPQSPLVSYPIMTQSMRPAIPHGSLAH